MQYIYQQVLERLLSHMSQAQRASLQLLIQRLLVAAGGPEYIGTFRILLIQGNDRDSARLLAILRAAQLSIALRAPDTFQLQVLVSSLPTAGSLVLKHHERSFSTLFMQDDPRVQLEMIEGCNVVPFNSRPANQPERWALAREAMLMFGYLIDARPEAVLGSRLHLELADTVRQAFNGKLRADAVVTAMPAQQRRRYLAWARRGLRLAGDGAPQPIHQCLATLAKGLGQLQTAVGSALEVGGQPTEAQVGEAPLRVMAIDDLLPPFAEEDPLDRMLGCQFDPAQNGTSLTAFLDPLALAQLRDLRNRSFAPAGQRQALRLTVHSGKIQPQEAQQARFVKAYGIDHTQLTCLLFSPFAERGRGLVHFVQCRHPDMQVALPYLHRALQGKACPDAVKDWLVNTSGLSLGQLRSIYEGRLQPAASGSGRLLASLARRGADLKLLPRQPCLNSRHGEASP
ncbi:hypothetical protein D3C76_189630 [compost metagenome]